MIKKITQYVKNWRDTCKIIGAFPIFFESIDSIFLILFETLGQKGCPIPKIIPDFRESLSKPYCAITCPIISLVTPHKMLGSNAMHTCNPGLEVTRNPYQETAQAKAVVAQHTSSCCCTHCRAFNSQLLTGVQSFSYKSLSNLSMITRIKCKEQQNNSLLCPACQCQRLHVNKQ